MAHYIVRRDIEAEAEIRAEGPRWAVFDEDTLERVVAGFCVKTVRR